MSKKNHPIDQKTTTQQQSLFDYIRELSDARRTEKDTEGTMNIREQLRRSLNRAIKESGRSRAQIAGEMSHLLGVDVTKTVIDAWTAESKDHYRIPAEYLPAFCRATESNHPIEIITEAAGMFSMPGPDALRSEIQKWSERARLARAEVRKRVIFLEEMSR